MSDTEAASRLVEHYRLHLTRPPSEVAADLESFANLLRKWQRVQNLVSRETLDQLWERHIADSLQVLPRLRETDRTILDLGSGGGLPAIPLAIASIGGERSFILIEPNSRKTSFLREVARQLRLPVTVEGRRADAVLSDDLPPVDVITARALAPLPLLCAMVAPFFGPRTRAILHKGREHVDELAESRAHWHLDVIVTRSVTDASGVLLEISNLHSKTS